MHEKTEPYKEIIIRAVEKNGESVKLRIKPSNDKSLRESMLDLMDEKIF